MKLFTVDHAQGKIFYPREHRRRSGSHWPEHLPLNPRAAAFSPAAAALLVIDMQRYFLCADSHAFLPAAPAIVPNIQALIAAFKKAARPVYFTRHANSARDAGQMAVWWRELLTREHPLGALNAALFAPGTRSSKKPSMTPFSIPTLNRGCAGTA